MKQVSTQIIFSDQSRIELERSPENPKIIGKKKKKKSVLNNHRSEKKYKGELEKKRAK